jgi:hypothetical protein
MIYETRHSTTFLVFHAIMEMQQIRMNKCTDVKGAANKYRRGFSNELDRTTLENVDTATYIAARASNAI